ncbi:MAG: PIG-L deacetylase family protein [Pseudomonadota bacterium]
MIDESQLVPYRCSELPVTKGPWLVFAPHADDESFGMGGTITLAAATGIDVHVVIMTDGSLGGEQDNLVNIREQEARAASALLGVSSVIFLKQKDRGLAVNPLLVNELVRLIEGSKPSAVFFPGIHEAHPDHRMTALLVWQALQKLGSDDVVPVGYEITGQSPINCLVDITTVIENKKQVIDVYQSQIGQKNYRDIVLALNRLRTFTLGKDVQWAEGFFVYEPIAIKGSLVEWAQQRLDRQLAE